MLNKENHTFIFKYKVLLNDKNHLLLKNYVYIIYY